MTEAATRQQLLFHKEQLTTRTHTQNVQFIDKNVSVLFFFMTEAEEKERKKGRVDTKSSAHDGEKMMKKNSGVCVCACVCSFLLKIYSAFFLCCVIR
jgi:hypothetical protein